MNYVIQLDNGLVLRTKNSMVYECLVRLHGYTHVLRDSSQTIIRKL